MQTVAFHNSCKWHVAKEPVSSKSWGKQMCFPCGTACSSNYPKYRLPFQSNAFLQIWLSCIAAPLQGPSMTLCSPRHLPYLHNPRLQLLHRFWFFVLHSGTHHLLLHHAVLMQCSLVLVQYPLLMPFTQVLYGRWKKNRYLVEAKRQQARKPSTSGTQTHGHALCNIYAADFCFFIFKRVKKKKTPLAAKNSRNKTAS